MSTGAAAVASTTQGAPGPGVGSENMSSKKPKIYFVIFCVLLDFLIVILAVFFLFWSFSPSGLILFSWHPALMSMGFICFMTQAILVYSESSIISRSCESYTKKIGMHWILNFAGLFCIFMGFLAIVANKFINEFTHLQSKHSIVGLTTIIFCCIASCGGLLAKYSFQLRKTITPVVTKVLHSVMGIISYILGAITIILGLYSAWFDKNWTSSERNFAIAAIMVIWIYACIKPTTLLVRRLHQINTSI